MEALARLKRKNITASAGRVRILKRTFLILCGVLATVILLTFTVQALMKMQILSLRSIAFSVGKKPPHDAFGHTNILLLGTGDKNHEGVDLTDTIMIASIDPKEGSAAMFSIPRDLWITKEGSRINTLYRDRKWQLQKTKQYTTEESAVLSLKETAQDIASMFGIAIHGTVKMDFSGFVEAIDRIGGVDLYVPYGIVDQTYPGPVVDSYQTFAISKGQQHLDGETALKYARSRHTTSDFGRSARQQQLLQAIMEKAKKENLIASPNTILSLWKILGAHLETTFSTRDMIGIAALAAKVNRSNVISMQLSDASSKAGGFLYSPPREEYAGASVLLPSGGKYGWERLRLFAHLVMNVRWTYLKKPQIHIVNAGAITGSAKNLADELTVFGFDVVSIRSISKEEAPLDSSSIESQADEDVTGYLSEVLRMPSRSMAPSSEAGSDNIDESSLTIFLGKDYVPSPLHLLLPAPE